MRKLTRKSLDELAEVMPIISEKVQREYVGGSGYVGTGSVSGSASGSSGNWDIDGGELPEVTVTGSQPGNNGLSPLDRWMMEYYMGGSSGSSGSSSSGSYGGSSSSWGSGGSSNYSVANHIKSLIGNDVYNILQSDMNIDLKKYAFKTGEECSVNARAINGTIEICSQFSARGYSTMDKCAIVWHEMYHINKKHSYVDWNATRKTISESGVMLNYTQEMWNYEYNSLKEVCPSYTPELLTFYTKLAFTYKTLLDPQYYKNEMETYSAEMNQFPDVSNSYKEERERLYNLNKLQYELALKYYN